MKTLIVYATRHGCTRACAKKMEDQLGNDVTLFEIKKNHQIDIASFDRIIVGGSIHAGQIQKSVPGFLNTHHDVLMTKVLGLFLCCMDEKKAQEQFDKVFSQELRDYAIACGILGGAFYFDRMNFLEKTIVKKIVGVQETVENINEQAISDFALAMGQ
ncbi:flavodoxin domain-containing protein [bacterium]|nr:flavodoxin domain-containing protein [bacterium]